MCICGLESSTCLLQCKLSDLYSCGYYLRLHGTSILIKRHSFKQKTGQQAKQPAEKREGHRFNKYSGRSFHSDRTGGDAS